MSTINNVISAVDIPGMYEAARCANTYLNNITKSFIPTTTLSEEVNNRPAAW